MAFLKFQMEIQPKKLDMGHNHKRNYQGAYQNHQFEWKLG